MDAGTNRRASRARTHAERGDISVAQEPRADEAAAPHAGGASCEAVHFWISQGSAGPQSAGAHHPAAADRSQGGGSALFGGDRGVGSGRTRAANRETRGTARE